METAARSHVESSAVAGAGEESSVESWAEVNTGRYGADESWTMGSAREVTAAAEDELVTGRVLLGGVTKGLREAFRVFPRWSGRSSGARPDMRSR